MAKKNKQPEPLYNNVLNQEIKDLMGPPPEEAEANDASYSEPSPESPAVEPKGPPPVVTAGGRVYLQQNQQDESTPKSIPPVKTPEIPDQKSPDPSQVEQPDNIEAKELAADPQPSTEQSATEKQPEPKNVSDVAEEINQQLLAQQASGPKPLKIVDNTASSEPSELEDEGLDKAVSDIISKESDELLAVEDAIRKSNAPEVSTKKPKKNLFLAWWRNKKLRYLTIAAILALFLGAALFPYSRYAILNSVGVRAGLSVKVIDAKYGLPIKNVEVSAGGQSATSDAEGKVQLNNVPLGETQLVFTKRSFAQKSQPIIVGWGSNPFNDPIQLEATGSAYSFTVTDWASGKPVSKVEVSDGDSKVLTDDNGKVSMLLQSGDKDVKFTIKADNYRTENVTIGSTDKTEKSVKLVASNPDIFVSKRSGKYDVYKKDVDGANEVVLMGGTGTEQDGLGILPNQAGSVVAVASTRDGKRDKDGFLLSNLYIIDVSAKSVVKIPDTAAAQIQLVEWVGDKLVFVKVISAASAATSERQKIISYDYKQDKSIVLASANYFNDVEVYKGQIYFAQNSTGGPAQLNRVNPDNSAKTVLLNQEVWQLSRIKNNRIIANAADKKWYEQQIGDAKLSEMANPPANTSNRGYIDSPNSEKTVWVDERDGKGVLILEDIKNSDSKIIMSKNGLGYPIRWLSNKHLLIRVSNSQETADYVLNIDGGEPVKVGDVTNTAQTNRWYYYR